MQYNEAKFRKAKFGAAKDNLEKALVECNIVEASLLLSDLYDCWDTLDKADQEVIKGLEPLYLTIVNAALPPRVKKDVD